MNSTNPEIFKKYDIRGNFLEDIDHVVIRKLVRAYISIFRPDEISDKLAPHLEAWLKDRTVLDLSVDGLSVKEVMEKQMTDFIHALFDINRLYDPNLSQEEKDNWRKTITTQSYIE